MKFLTKDTDVSPPVGNPAGNKLKNGHAHLNPMQDIDLKLIKLKPIGHVSKDCGYPKISKEKEVSSNRGVDTNTCNSNGTVNRNISVKECTKNVENSVDSENARNAAHAHHNGGDLRYNLFGSKVKTSGISSNSVFTNGVSENGVTSNGLTRDKDGVKKGRSKKKTSVKNPVATNRPFNFSAKKNYHWQSESSSKKDSSDDMVLLTKITEAAITDNLKKRFMQDRIYTYIGPVLVAVNPFKTLDIYGDPQISFYQDGGAYYEAPPHVYAISDSMYKNMITDAESQCVIISGESGAGKTVSAKFIMNYLTDVSGGGSKSQQVKEVIRESNPLLEAFGNAKTLRNNNSSRFGKYIKIAFSPTGAPQSGSISNFLLEKSRVHCINEGERSFHIFYQLCEGATDEMREELGIMEACNYAYLAQSDTYQVDNIDDSSDFAETLQAMTVMNMDEDVILEVMAVVASVLHMGQIPFEEDGNDAIISDNRYLEFPAHLLGVHKEALERCLTSHVIETIWGSKTERVTVTHNLEQAHYARDAWAKGLYSKLFDFLVERVNRAMAPAPTSKGNQDQELTLGILDIYGFEIFSQNGFEQFCINFVNEKLQQIFIELTLKSEQEEYQAEGIQWKPIEFFNNKDVCNLIESGKDPVGIFRILDDVCSINTLAGADKTFKDKMVGQLQSNPYLQPMGDCFLVKHYAGDVTYNVDGFCDKNRDLLFQDILEVMQKSENLFIRNLFVSEGQLSKGPKGRPTTAGTKIRQQANHLVAQLSACVPHYIRCIKPNETKRPKDWDDAMVRHQVGYLGLRENIKVKRAGFAYRRPFENFLKRYAILSEQTFPVWHGNPKKGVEMILNEVGMDPTQYQIGKTKAFIKDPESLYLLEEYRDRTFDHYARIVQKFFREKFSTLKSDRQKMEAASLLKSRKERRSASLDRNFYGDYLGINQNTRLSMLIPRREKTVFACPVDKYDRVLRTIRREIVLTNKFLRIIGKDKDVTGSQLSWTVVDKAGTPSVVKRTIALSSINCVTMSKYQDNFVLIDVAAEHGTLMEVPLKTEFIYLLHKCMKDLGRDLRLEFSDTFVYTIKKEGWGGGSERRVNFFIGSENSYSRSIVGKTLIVTVTQGLPPSSLPSGRTKPKQSNYQANSRRAPPPVPQSASLQRPASNPKRFRPAVVPKPETVKQAQSAPKSKYHDVTVDVQIINAGNESPISVRRSERTLNKPKSVDTKSPVFSGLSPVFGRKSPKVSERVKKSFEETQDEDGWDESGADFENVTVDVQIINAGNESPISVRRTQKTPKPKNVDAKSPVFGNLSPALAAKITPVFGRKNPKVDRKVNERLENGDDDDDDDDEGADFYPKPGFILKPPKEDRNYRSLPRPNGKSSKLSPVVPKDKHFEARRDMHASSPNIVKQEQHRTPPKNLQSSPRSIPDLSNLGKVQGVSPPPKVSGVVTKKNFGRPPFESNINKKEDTIPRVASKSPKISQISAQIAKNIPYGNHTRPEADRKIGANSESSESFYTEIQPSNSLKGGWPGVDQSTPSPPKYSAPENQHMVKPSVPPKNLKNKVKAMYAYTASADDEITFNEGDILEVISEDPSGWWTCRIGNQAGFCPGNYVKYL